MNWPNLFKKPTIIAIIADTNQGKTNTIHHILNQLENYTCNTYTYSIKSNNEIHSLNELEQLKNSIIIIDELPTLFDLEDRKQKRQIENTLRLIHHNNNVLLLCGLGENFKKFLSAKINYFVFKKLTINDLINGSRAKTTVLNYNGPERGNTMLNLEINEAIVYDGFHYHKTRIPYVEEKDTKKENVPIIVPKNVHKKVQKKGEKWQQITIPK